MQIEVPGLREEEITTAANGEATAPIRARVEAARSRQIARQSKPNARLSGKEIDRHCVSDPAAQQLLKQAISRMGLSARAYHRVLKVARSIADLAASETIGVGHVAEAVQYRRWERAG